MNRTNFEHAGFALLVQGVIGFLTHNWFAGACAGFYFFLGREHAQYEYKIGDPSKLKPWEGFKFWNWSRDSQLDLLFPLIAVSLVWGFNA